MVQVRLPDKVLLPNAAKGVRNLLKDNKVLLNKEDMAEARVLSRNMDKNHLLMELNPDKPARELMEGTGILMNKKGNMARVSALLTVILWVDNVKANQIMALHKMKDKVHTDSKVLNQASMASQDMASSMEAREEKVTTMDSNNAVMEITVVLNIVNRKPINTREDVMATNTVTNKIGSKNNNVSMVVINMGKSNSARDSKEDNMALTLMLMKEIRVSNPVTDKVIMDILLMDNHEDMNHHMVNQLMVCNGINGLDKAVHLDANQVRTGEDKKMHFVEDQKNLAATRVMPAVMNIANLMITNKAVVGHQVVLHNPGFVV